MSDFQLFSYMFTASKGWGYLHNIGVNPSDFGDGDTKTNLCGITYQHSFSIVDLIQLFENGGDTGTVIANLYILKDPRAELSITDYTGPWNTNDTARWTEP